MATDTQQKLAEALNDLRLVQETGSRVVRSSDLSRAARERLTNAGFLLEVLKGWYVSTHPSARPGDTTPWYSSFWEFCSRYCSARFEQAWHLSAEQSLKLHAESTTVPTQTMVLSPSGNNLPVKLAFGTSLFVHREAEAPPQEDIVVRDGLRLFARASALVRASEGFFVDCPVEARVVLNDVKDPSEILRPLLDGGNAAAAGRLAGAFRHVGQYAFADEIVATMTAAGHLIREKNPFKEDAPTAPSRRVSGFVARMEALWATSRQVVIDIFPSREPAPTNVAHVLERIDEIYERDAYNSLSIEGYQVTPELIERVASGAWDPNGQALDAETADALAARGYFLAFGSVKTTVASVLSIKSLSSLREAHRDWYRQLFTPNVQAGLLKPSMLAC
jgi:hypothetical protein